MCCVCCYDVANISVLSVFWHTVVRCVVRGQVMRSQRQNPSCQCCHMRNCLLQNAPSMHVFLSHTGKPMTQSTVARVFSEPRAAGFRPASQIRTKAT